MACTVVIPSYRRGVIALESIAALRALSSPPREILLVDQTPDHPDDVEARLRKMASEGAFVWIRLEQPSIPRAMNAGLQAASNETVLFLDDDILPRPGLVSSHEAAHARAALVAGQVLQPGQEEQPLAQGEKFRFNSDAPAWVGEFMGGNFSVDRAKALALGGFDENFVGAAYRFEAEFADRFVKRHGPILFEPGASIRHLALSTGGTRAHGHHLRTASPAHSVGAYYFLLRARPKRWLLDLLWRPLRSVRTKYHLAHPWSIPASLLAEARGFGLALRLHRDGPRLLAERSQPSEARGCV